MSRARRTDRARRPAGAAPPQRGFDRLATQAGEQRREQQPRGHHRRGRIAGQPDDELPRASEPYRLAGLDRDLGEDELEPQRLEHRLGEILLADRCAAGDDDQVRASTAARATASIAARSSRSAFGPRIRHPIAPRARQRRVTRFRESHPRARARFRVRRARRRC